jgi:outer membrane immunogenic protein
MKAVLLAAALLLGTSAYAFAADAVEEVVIADAAYDWSGLYVGAQFGYGWGDATTRETSEGDDGDPLDYDVDGFFGGAHLGYNFQSGSVVYGAEADLEYADVEGFWDWENTNGLSKRLEWQGSLRGRLGYSFDRVLLYGTAGLAFANVKMEVVEGNAVALSDREWTAGWTAGVGAQYALTEKLSLTAEYRYSDYGDTSISGDVFGGTYTYPHDNKINSVRFGFSTKF